MQTKDVLVDVQSRSALPMTLVQQKITTWPLLYSESSTKTTIQKEPVS
ncbi:hypothetical protein BH09BAC4_BH09BAC4_43810 [soil metagenome]